MTQSPSRETTWMFTNEQVRRMLPDGASDNQRAINARCKRAGAVAMWGWPAAEIEQVKNKRTVTSIEVGDEPIEVLTFEQVVEAVAHLEWHMSESSVRWHLNETGTRAHRGYAPVGKVREAMQRPAGRDWRRHVGRGPATRTFLPQSNDDE